MRWISQTNDKSTKQKLAAGWPPDLNAQIRLFFHFVARFFISFAQSLKHGGAYNWQADRGIQEDFAEFTALVRRNKLAPGNRL